MYAKILNNAVVKYPYQWADFMADNNNTQGLNPNDLLTIFPQTDIAKKGYSVVAVTAAAQPAFNAITQDCVEGVPALVNGVWTQTWVITLATAAEQSARLAAQTESQFQTALGTGITITSTATPALNGAYAVDPTTQFNINSEVVSILTNGVFTNGQTTKAWPDISGPVHVFTVAQFKTFATAVSNYVDGLITTRSTLLAGQSAAWPTASATIP
jgi:hypothetical protein